MEITTELFTLHAHKFVVRNYLIRRFFSKDVVKIVTKLKAVINNWFQVFVQPQVKLLPPELIKFQRNDLVAFRVSWTVDNSKCGRALTYFALDERDSWCCCCCGFKKCHCLKFRWPNKMKTINKPVSHFLSIGLIRCILVLPLLHKINSNIKSSKWWHFGFYSTVVVVAVACACTSIMK